MSNKVLIITGPTASGKTALAERIALEQQGEIINADVGQFYTALIIGTAKPNWKDKPFPCHLFDILDKPIDLSVADFRRRVVALVQEIQARKKLPIIVGGSAFYIKSLFFPPQEHALIIDKKDLDNIVTLDSTLDVVALWEKLHTIDPERAQELHQNDRYRIQRALGIWYATGKKPSTCNPRYEPAFPMVNINFLMPPQELLDTQIEARTRAMIAGEWLEEAANLMGTEWEDFIVKKGLIGYQQIFKWIMAGKRNEANEALEAMIKEIVCKTRQYAKRQMVFLRKFKQELQQYDSCLIE